MRVSSASLVGLAAFVWLCPVISSAGAVDVTDDAALQAALRRAAPGTVIRIAAGRYQPGVFVTGLKGTPERPIVIEGADPEKPPLFEGGNVAWQLSDCEHVTLRNLAVRGQQANGINIDDGGSFDTPARHIVLEKIRVADVGPQGNCDGIKLSGVDDFTVRDCTVEGWGGQAIDMVGCHRGVIEGCTFRGKPGFSQSTGPQTKGGSSQVVIRRCLFQDAGSRAVNLGGSTGLAYFRPRGALYEARDICVEACTFVGSQAPVAFVGVENAVVRYNTIYRPGKWVLRILQETTEPGFAPCRNNRFERNLVVCRRADVQITVNVGPHTRPDSFTFADNLWFCEDRPEASRPDLPAAETDGVYGVDPRLAAQEDGRFRPQNPQAAQFGAFAWPEPAAEAGGQTGNYLGPCALAASPDGKMLYVACADARQVAWVELPGGKVVRRVAVPAEPTGLVLTSDGKQLIVTCAAPQSSVVVLETATGDCQKTVPAGHTAGAPVLSPDGKRLYVCNRFSHNVSVIDLPAGKELTRIPAVREPIAAAVTPDGRSVLVANHLPNTRTDAAFMGDVSPVVTVIDAQTLATTAIPLLHGANGIRHICVLPDGSHALVPHLLSNFQMVPFRVDTGWINTNVVSVIDLRQRKVVGTIGMDEFDMGAGNPWGVVWTADGKWVCVSQAGTHELRMISTADLLGEFARRTMQPMMAVWPIYPSLGESLWRRVKLPGRGPRGIAVVGSNVYVAEYFSDTLAVVDVAAAGAGSACAVDTIALGDAPQLTVQRRGELLFHDATICYQQWQSCASCHPEGRVDSLNWDLMNDGVGNPKNTKSMLLAHRTPPSMAAGVRMSAEEAVRSGISHVLFSQRPEDEAVAIDEYLKSLQPVPSPHLIGDRLSPAAERGRLLFHSDRIACHKCHPAPLYTDMKRHSVGTRSPYETEDRFDTPTLVEVWRTAPYLHDGRYTTIKELLAEGEHGLKGRLEELSQQDLDDVVEFVLSL